MVEKRNEGDLAILVINTKNVTWSIRVYHCLELQVNTEEPEHGYSQMWLHNTLLIRPLTK